MSEKFGKERVVREIKESLGHKLVTRREAPLLGLIFFSIALWGSKLFTMLSPGTTIEFTIAGYDIHLHHFHYGIIALILGVILTFFEGRWFVRFKHIFFGAGLGLIVDEYWLLLTFDGSYYFDAISKFISAMIGLVITIIYVVIIVVVYFRTKEERQLWQDLYDAVASGKAKIDI